MQQMQQTEQSTGLRGTERKRVEAVVETLATARTKGENLAEVAHDTRNMVTALALYCDLLDEPGVLAKPYVHYGNELRLVAAASRRLVERLVALDTRQGWGTASQPGGVIGQEGLPEKNTQPTHASTADRTGQPMHWDPLPSAPIASLASELLANRNLLAALAAPSIAVTVDAEGGSLPVWLTGEDLTRILVNLVKNAVDAMPGGGQIQIGLHEFHAGTETSAWLVLTIEDNGPGIPGKELEKIFESGYTSRSTGDSTNEGCPGGHRGLGLAIARSIVEGAGGRIHATNRTPSGARFKIELPVRSR
jgi:signal transduction histidine kinase